MDNVTHSLTGWALGQTGLKRKTRKGLAALILGANMPDIDVFFGWVPWVPLATHRGFTHGIVGGVLLMPLLLAALLWLFDKWQQRSVAEFPSGLPMHFGWLVALSYIGAISHPLLDLQNAYAVQLLSPLSSDWFHTDGLFIIDVWILVGLGTAIWLSMRREGRERPNPGLPAIAALCLIVCYIVLNIGISAVSKEALANDAPYANPDVVVSNPVPGLFWRRELVWRQDGAISHGTYDPLQSLVHLQTYTPPVPDGMDDPIARQALQATPEVVRFMRWSILPVARVQSEGCVARVSFNDARFEDGLARNRFWISVNTPVHAPGC